MRVDFSDAVLSYITVSDYCDLSEVILPVDKSCYLINDIREMRNYIENRLMESESDFLRLLLKLQISEKEGEKMSILCLNDLYNQIKKFIKKENQIDALKLWEEISTDLLKKNILSKWFNWVSKKMGIGRRISNEKIEQEKKITQFECPDDPIREILGRGMDSNPEE